MVKLFFSLLLAQPDSGVEKWPTGKKGRIKDLFTNLMVIRFSQHVDYSSFVGKGNHSVVKEEDSLSTPLVRHLVFPYDLRDDRPPKFMLPPFQIQFSVNNWKK